MTAPTTISNSNNPGPIQRLQGYAKFATAASDAYSSPATGGAASPTIVLGSGVLTLTCGFIPKRVRVVNVTTRIQSEFFSGMAALSTLDTDVNGTMSLNVAGPFTVSVDEGTQGSVSQAYGTAPAAAGGKIVLTLSGFATNADIIVWQIDG
jgi:hypothetical protein